MAKIKKVWLIEKYSEHSDKRTLLAFLDSRLNYKKIIFAMKVLMLSDCESISDMLTVNSISKEELFYPHQFMNYPFIIAGSSQYYKAPYRAWVGYINLETMEYSTIDSAYDEFQKKLTFN